MKKEDLLNKIKDLAEDKKAYRPVIVDLKGMSDICSHQIICSGGTEKHTIAIAKNIQIQIKNEFGIIPENVEGLTTGEWILLDYGSTIVHIFLDSLRKYYALEDLWGKVNVNERSAV